jgi:dienelactone hydrolase
MIRIVLRCGLAWIAASLLGPAAMAQPEFKEPAKYQPTGRELAEIKDRIDALAKSVAELKGKAPRDDPRTGEPLSDVEVCLKAARWIVRFNEFYNEKYVGMTLRVLERGRERAAQLAAGKAPWASAKGETVRGYVSQVDGSVQPYAVAVPESYNGEEATRLDVVLHGRGATLNEVSFFAAHDGKPAAADEPGLVLHVFGRTNNAYRWAGEADVFEAIEAVKRNYRVDERRVVLRGFSMGGAGAWHLGLHHPSLWCSVEAGAGFTDTKKYMNLGPLPAYQEKGLHIYDAVDVAVNAFDVPIAGYGGEEDKQLQASLNIKGALETLGVAMKKDSLVTRAEGIDFLHVIGAKTGHKVDPDSAKILKTFRDEHAARGLDPRPARIRFATYTLRYNRAPWLTVVRLGEHYARAFVDAEIKEDEVRVTAADNVAILAVDRDAGETIRFGGQSFPLRPAVKGLLPQVYFRRLEQGWEQLDYDQSRAVQENVERGKRHGLQGPIDDAFSAPFLCVRGTDTPWNPRVQDWADARLKRFAELWPKYLRGDLPIKDDVDVTDADIEGRHLILFGDPGSNRLLRRLLFGLPMTWTRDEVRLAGRHPSADHSPALIAPNPLNPYRYVVVNSGHTFDAKAFAGSNALLYPRLGDYAVFRVGESHKDGEVKVSGYFDERWKAP